MPLSTLGDQTCSVARAVAEVGDPWVLMIVRELFLGSRRFDEFLAYTSASPPLLTERLRALERAGIVERTPYQERPVRYEYRLSEKGMALWPVISALREWGDRWHREPGGAPLRLHHRGCGKHVALKLTCVECGAEVGPRDVDVKLSAAATRERRSARTARKRVPAAR
jgi:DNA-binding HxlR family transcriptional regulator